MSESKGMSAGVVALNGFGRYQRMSLNARVVLLDLCVVLAMADRLAFGVVSNMRRENRRREIDSG